MANSKQALPLSGVYVGDVITASRRIPIALQLFYGTRQVISQDPGDLVTHKQETSVSFVLHDEAGPYNCSDFDFNVEMDSIRIIYSRNNRVAASSSDWDLYMDLVWTGDQMRGSLHSRSIGYVGEMALLTVTDTCLKVKPTIVGLWTGESSLADGTALKVALSLEAGQRTVENPVNYDLSFTPSKVGSLSINGWAFPLPSTTFDYFSGKLHCVHKVAENGPRLQLTGILDNDGHLDAKLQTSIGGSVAALRLVKN
jgi:hypothetical protein